MTTIAPILFHAFPEGASHHLDEPSLECFNAGASTEAARTLSTPFEPSRAAGVAAATAVLGLLPLLGSGTGGLFMLVLFRDKFIFNMPDWLLATILSGLGLALVSGAWSAYLFSSRHPKAKVWKSALGDAWLTHGGQIIALDRVPYAIRSEVKEDLTLLEDIRQGLNRLAPSGGDLSPIGDELDGVRYAMQRYIEVSDIPVLGRRAAAAPHIKDPAVRQAAKDHAKALTQKKFARIALDTEIEGTKELLADRRQARTDAEIIRLVHER